MELRVGSRIFDKNKQIYVIKSFINRSTFGDEFKIERINDNKIFALNTVSVPYLNNNEYHELIIDGRRTELINHPNVNKVHFFHDGELFKELPIYMIKDYISGESLRDLLEKQKKFNKKFDDNFLNSIMIQIAEGMKNINDNIIHKNIKPEDIRIENGQVKITGFGISKAINSANNIKRVKDISHLKYMAPESWLNENDNIQMDMYSIGVILYELFTLNHPYEVDISSDPFISWKKAHMLSVVTVPNTIKKSISYSLFYIILRMLNKNPNERYSTWDEIIKNIIDKSVILERVDVSLLVKNFQQNQNENLTKKIELENKYLSEEVKQKTISYRFQDIVKIFEDITASLRKQVNSVDIELVESNNTIKALYKRKEITAVCFEVTKELKYRGKEVIAWGFIKAITGHGFNIILAKNNKDDIYGKWISLHHSQSPMNNRKSMIEPFCLENFREIERKMKNIGTIDIFNTTESYFETKHLIELFKKII